jgi:hypothetical protein
MPGERERKAVLKVRNLFFCQIKMAKLYQTAVFMHTIIVHRQEYNYNIPVLSIAFL